MAPALCLIDDVDAVVLAIGPGDAEEEGEPAPEAEPPLAGKRPLEDKLIARAAEVLARLLAHTIQEDLVLVSQTSR
jgi:hypothetical protein